MSVLDEPSVSQLEPKHQEEEEKKEEVEEDSIPRTGKFVIAYTSSNIMAMSIWFNTVITVYAYDFFGKNNLIVGLLSFVYGVFQISCAMLASLHVDRNPTWRPKALLVGFVFGFAGVASMTVSVWWCWKVSADGSMEDVIERRRSQLPLMLVSSACVGIMTGLVAPSAECIFASVIPKGKRDARYATKSTFEALSGLAAVVTSVILFVVSSNDWSMRAMSIAMFGGLALHIIPLVLILCLSSLSSDLIKQEAKEEAAAAKKKKRKLNNNNNNSSDEDEDDTWTVVSSIHPASEIASQAAEQAVTRSVAAADAEEKEKERKQEDEGESASVVSGTSRNSRKKSKKKKKQKQLISISAQKGEDQNSGCCCCSCCCSCCSNNYESFLVAKKETIPYLQTCLDVISLFGSGMTVRFLFLFLVDDFHFDPISVILSGGGAVLLTAICVKLNSIISTKCLTRMQNILLVRFIGPMFLLVLALCNDSAPPALILAAFILRWGLSNSSPSLSRSLIMDIVPKERRTIWNAVESVLSFSWSLSSLVGGALSDKFGYRTNFKIAFGLFMLSCLVYSSGMLTPEVRGEEAEATEEENNNNNNNNNNNSDQDNEEKEGNKKRKDQLQKEQEHLQPDEQEGYGTSSAYFARPSAEGDLQHDGGEGEEHNNQENAPLLLHNKQK